MNKKQKKKKSLFVIALCSENKEVL